MHTLLIAINKLKYLARLILTLFHNDVNLLRSFYYKKQKRRTVELYVKKRNALTVAKQYT